MRKLTNREREYAKQLLKARAKTVNIVMTIFKVWGGLQIFAVIMYALLGAPKKDIPFMLIGCVILYLVYFKFTGFLANQNQWMVLLRAIKKGKEFAYEGTLVKTYERRAGGDNGAHEFRAVLLLGDKEESAEADNGLENAESGSSVVMFSVYENPEIGTRLVMAAMPD